MFDSVLGRGNVPGARLGAGAVTSIIVHVLVLGVAVWFSTRPPVEEEEPPEVTFFAAPPPPPPPPPPPASTATEHKEVKKKPKLKPETVVKAKDTTPQPEEEQASAEEAPEEEPVEGGVEGGVIGGVAGGVVGGVIGGTIGGQLGGLGGEVLSFGEGMTRPERTKGRAPEYTREAREAQIQGTMIVQCVITTKGELENCKIIKPLPYMEQAVLDALKTWKMTPVTFQGRPVAVKYNIPIRLVLPR